MKTICHISDLHFGTEDKTIANGLLKDIIFKKPDLVVISGDLTQRARSGQFKAAREYIDKIPFPKIIVPGNHDIPLFDLFRRFLFPLTRFKKYITENLSPVHKDDEMAVLGINTARSFTWKNGRISLDQMKIIKDLFCPIKIPFIEVLVIHHQFIPSPDDEHVALVGRADKALDILDECGIDLVLAGHLHEGFAGDIQTYYPGRRSIIIAQAGTAISRRRRGEPNAYNFIKLDEDHISIEIRVWKENIFDRSADILYKKIDEKWVKEEQTGSVNS